LAERSVKGFVRHDMAVYAMALAYRGLFALLPFAVFLVAVLSFLRLDAVFGTIKLNVRTFDEDVREKVLDAIKRIVEAEAEASDAPKSPEITRIDRYPLTVNDPDATKRIAGAFGDHFDHNRVEELSAPVPASEDFGSFGTE
jgi:hypothetical protein